MNDVTLTRSLWVEAAIRLIPTVPTVCAMIGFVGTPQPSQSKWGSARLSLIFSPTPCSIQGNDRRAAADDTAEFLSRQRDQLHA